MAYALGLTYPPTALTIPQPFPAQWTPWTRTVGQNGQGAAVTMGPPTLIWSWAWLLYADVETLLDLLAGEASAPVYVTTRMDDGTYATFYAQMWRPVSTHAQGGRRANVSVRFAQLDRVPEFSAGEVGDVAATTVVVTFTNDVYASNYATGVAIKVNGASATISSATRQSNHAIVHYVLSAAVTAGQTVTWEYSASTGDYVSELARVDLPTTSAQSVTNNV